MIPDRSGRRKETAMKSPGDSEVFPTCAKKVEECTQADVPANGVYGPSIAPYEGGCSLTSDHACCPVTSIRLRRTSLWNTSAIWTAGSAGPSTIA
jgi:hypothetical protein